MGGWEWNEDDSALFWTDQLYRILDVKPDTSTADPLGSLRQSLKGLSLQDREIFLRAFRDCLQKGRPYTLEFPFTTAKGRHIWIRTVGESLKKEKGKNHVFGAVIDITHARQTANALRESKLFMESVLESIQDGISVLEPDLTIRHVNSVMKRWYSQNLPLEGKKCFVCYHNADKPCDPCPAQRCLESKKTEMEIVPGLPGSGVEWIELYCYPITHPQTGKITGVVEFVRDVTQKMKAEAALKESVAKYRLIFDSVSDLIYTHDLEGRFISVNPAMQKCFGYAFDEMIGHKISEFMEPEFKRAFDTEYLTGIQNEGYYEGISRYITKDGNKIYIEYKNRLVHLGQGEVFISGVGRDVTEKVLSEKKLEKLQKQLAHAQKMESIGTLAGGIAHDFNNILSPMFGYLEMMLEDVPQGSPLHGRLVEVFKGAKRARDLTRQILLFSRQTDYPGYFMKVIN